MTDILFAVLLTALEDIAYQVLVGAVLPRKGFRRGALSYLAELLLLIVFGLIPVVFLAGQVYLKGFALICLWIGCTYIFYDGPFFLRAYIAALVYVTTLSVDLLAIIFMPTEADYAYGHILEYEWFVLLMAMFSKLLLLLAAYLLRLLFKQMPNLMAPFMERSSKKTSGILFIFSLVLVTVNVFIVEQTVYGVSTKPMVKVLSSLSLVATNLLLYFVVGIVARQAASKSEIALLQQQRDLQYQHTMDISNYYLEQNHKAHEFSNQLRTIGQLLAYEEYARAMEYVKTITADNFARSYQAYTGNLIIDSVINLKERTATRAGVKLTVFCGHLRKIKMKDEHLSSILSNLLDNAIEGSAHTRDRPPEIWLKMDADNDDFLISIQNTVAHEAEIVDNLVETTKEDKRAHGLGLKNIASILREYGTSYEIFYEEGKFHFITNIPNV